MFYDIKAAEHTSDSSDHKTIICQLKKKHDKNQIKAHEKNNLKQKIIPTMQVKEYIDC